MNIAGSYRYRPWRFGLALAAVVWVQSLFGGTLVEEKFDVLKTRTGTYTNVTVTSKTADYVFILHANGMINVKITDLTMDVRRQLGYATTPEPAVTNEVATVAAREAADEHASIAASGQGPEWKLPAGMSLQDLRKLVLQFLLIVLAVSLVIYLFTCFCLRLICIKSNYDPGLLIWIPGFQLIPLFRAAGMSPLWFAAILAPAICTILAATGTFGGSLLVLISPIAPLVAHVVWCINIVKARNKASWLALPLLLPITYFPTLIYLAFSSAAPADEAPPRYKSMALQTA
ncbi:MAG: hypothetical protein U1F98_14630 [Verrucomicrobiota bacterium]